MTTAMFYLVLSLVFKNSDKIYIGSDYVEDEVGSISRVKRSQPTTEGKTMVKEEIL